MRGSEHDPLPVGAVVRKAHRSSQCSVSFPSVRDYIASHKPMFGCSNGQSLYNWQCPSHPALHLHSPIDKPPAMVSQNMVAIFLGSHGCQVRWSMSRSCFFVNPYALRSTSKDRVALTLERPILYPSLVVYEKNSHSWIISCLCHLQSAGSHENCWIGQLPKSQTLLS